ncbi:hypothetical protein [Cellulomonas triticagri]|uniref:Uncharacterized protein n=1 Tax=Cellulomonas triticagri TaxID=2483352 RepID=A0A3M2JCV4_9CELL|nr:hypothetical protein [Cellulomonas triticagri]RMI09393.1 hypothetical protein EBM89_10450 [Cellulomonas triticagri]
MSADVGQHDHGHDPGEGASKTAPEARLGTWAGLTVWSGAWALVVVLSAAAQRIEAVPGWGVPWLITALCPVLLRRRREQRNAVRLWWWSLVHAGSHLACLIAPVGPASAVAAVVGVVASVSLGVATRSVVVCAFAAVLSALAVAGTLAALGAA